MRRIKKLELQVAELQRQVRASNLDFDARLARAMQGWQITLSSEGITRLVNKAKGVA